MLSIKMSWLNFFVRFKQICFKNACNYNLNVREVSVWNKFVFVEIKGDLPAEAVE